MGIIMIDAGGVKELLIRDDNGIVLADDNPDTAADAILKFYNDRGFWSGAVPMLPSAFVRTSRGTKPPGFCGSCLEPSIETLSHYSQLKSTSLKRLFQQLILI